MWVLSPHHPSVQVGPRRGAGLRVNGRGTPCHFNNYILAMWHESGKHVWRPALFEMLGFPKFLETHSSLRSFHFVELRIIDITRDGVDS